MYRRPFRQAAEIQSRRRRRLQSKGKARRAAENSAVSRARPWRAPRSRKSPPANWPRQKKTGISRTAGAGRNRGPAKGCADACLAERRDIRRLRTAKKAGCIQGKKTRRSQKTGLCAALYHGSLPGESTGLYIILLQIAVIVNTAICCSL